MRHSQLWKIVRMGPDLKDICDVLVVQFGAI